MRALALALLLIAVPAFAEDAKNGWHFEVTPYIWGAAATGTVGIQGLPELKVEASFSDIFSKFDVGFLGRFEGRKGRFGFSSDLVYLNLGIPLAEDQPVILILGPEVDLRQFMGEGIGFYRVARDAKNPDGAWLDVFAGARYTRVRTEIIHPQTGATSNRVRQRLRTVHRPEPQSFVARDRAQLRPHRSCILSQGPGRHSLPHEPRRIQ